MAAGALAAELLVGACASDDPRVVTVRDVARDLGLGLSSLSEAGTSGSLVEAALSCADLATLAACNLSGLSDDARPGAVASTHLAAGTTRALVALVEAEFDAGDAGDGAYAENVLRDVRSAGWKADLAVRQLDGTG